MFEKEVKFTIDFTLNRIKKLGSFFTFEKLASVEIHPAIILYISNKLDYLIYEDRKKLLQNSSFDYSGSEISKYFNLISEEIKKNKRLAFEDVKTLVSHAVTFNINYLVRPGWTLGKLIFDENNTRNVNEIKMMLNYLYFYDYIRNVFLGYFSKRKILSLSETEFGLILNKIDKQMLNEHTQDLIDNALVSIGDFFNEGGLNKTRISTQTVEVFLKEKNLMEALFKLRRSIPAEDKGKYDIEEIRKILYSKEPVTIKHEKEEEAVEEVVAEEEVLEEEVPEEEVLEKEVSEEEILEEEIPEEEAPDEVVIESKDRGKRNLVEEEDDSETKTEPREDEVIFEEPEWEDEEEIQEEEEKIEENLPSVEDIQEEEKSKTKAGDDFLARYESELKSLEELEAQLNSLDKEDVSFENLDEAVKKGVFEIEENTKEPENEETLTFEEIMSGAEENEDEDEAIEIEENIRKPGNKESLYLEEIISDEEENEKDVSETEENMNEPDIEETLTLEEVMADEEEYEELKKEKENKVEKERDEEEELSDEIIIEEEEVNPFGEGKKKVVESSPQPRKNNDILSFLTDKEMDKIVSKVFNDDEEDFVNTMEKISDSATYDEATEILKAVFFSYKVSPFSRDAVTLTNAVSNFFNQE